MDKIVDKQGNEFNTTEVARFNEKYLAMFKQLSELSIAKKKGSFLCKDGAVVCVASNSDFILL